MGVVCVPEACAVYTRVYTEEEKKRKKKEKKKKRKNRQGKGVVIWFQRHQSVQGLMYTCMWFFLLFQSLSLLLFLSLSFFFSSHFDVSVENSPTPFICLHPTCLRLIDQLLLGRLLFALAMLLPILLVYPIFLLVGLMLVRAVR